ncbi:hypothetical protein CYMTET_26633 [Cymbomonas tetramitiformis]|uniref:Uncharacterized protein n=1 Tax=Cymbomonas tetramitiformis TaxID=36881 RepID=A0AAE0KXP9_9CHLO|nr:hypothetical protein CYMTET_26633 [Cymbomonas tetramitiformis]
MLQKPRRKRLTVVLSCEAPVVEGSRQVGKPSCVRTMQASYLHQELQKQLAEQRHQKQQQMQAQQIGGGTSQQVADPGLGGFSDYFFDMVGWSAVLAGLCVGWIMLARSQSK